MRQWIIGAVLVLWVCVPATARPSDVCLSEDDASTVVVKLEKCKNLEEGLQRCAEAVDASEEAAQYCESLRVDLNKRIVILTKERDDAIAMAADAAEAGKKVGSTPWYRRAWDAGKWALAGGAAVAISIAVAGR